jgi:subtilase family serine protease
VSAPDPNLDIIAVSPKVNGPTGYTPAQLRHAYGFDQISGLPKNNYNNAGNGQTIAIINFFSDPTLRNDVQQFNEYFKIQGAAGNAADTSFLRIVNQNGGTALPAPATYLSNADLEASLDVEWAHAIAPGANILEVEADSVSDSDANAAVQYAERQPNVSVISMSYTDGFEDPSEYLDDGLYTNPVGHQGVAFVAATGDFGAPDLGYQTVSPNVLGVGGTTLPADKNGKPDRSLETGWSTGSDTNLGFPDGASTGGISTVEAEPIYQAGIQGTPRAVIAPFPTSLMTQTPTPACRFTTRIATHRVRPGARSAAPASLPHSGPP